MAKALESENVTVPSSIRKNLAGFQPKAMFKSLVHTIVTGTPKVARMAASLVQRFVKWLLGVIRNPASLGPMMKNLWEVIKKEVNHYHLGFRLLGQDVKTSSKLLRRVVSGNSLTRRERKLLVRTTSDMFRLIPMSVFILVPAMEFLLPFALYLFPNMLPTQFQSSLKKEEDLKRQLKVRVELAQFLSETSAEYSRLLAKRAEGTEKKDAEELTALVKKVRSGGSLENKELLAITKLFSDQLTLDNISKAQLLAMAQYMGVSTFGTEGMLRGRVRSKMQELKEDDQQILWEGVDTLNKEELRDAATARGMRSIGLTEEGLRTQLEQWLELSVTKSVPVVMLILSRALALHGTSQASGSPERLLEKSLAALGESVVNEAVLSGATEDSKDAAIRLRTLQLQAVEHQNTLIELERKAAEAAEAADEAAFKAEEARARADAVQADMVAGRVSHAEYEKAREAAAKVEQAAVDARLAAEAEFSKISGQHAKELKATVSNVEAQLGVEAGELGEGDIVDPARLQALGKEAGLTAEAIEALEMLASESAVLKERATLARIKASRMQEQASEMLAKGRIAKKKRGSATASDGEASGEPAKKKEEEEASPKTGSDASLDYTASSVAGVLDSMISRLEGQVDSVDSAIGDKLHLLDKDGDGVLSRQELEDVVGRLMKLKGVQEGDTVSVGDMLDLDKDGNITKKDLKLIAGVLAEAEAEAEASESEASHASDTEATSERR